MCYNGIVRRPKLGERMKKIIQDMFDGWVTNSELLAFMENEFGRLGDFMVTLRAELAELRTAVSEIPGKVDNLRQMHDDVVAAFEAFKEAEDLEDIEQNAALADAHARLEDALAREQEAINEINEITDIATGIFPEDEVVGEPVDDEVVEGEDEAVVEQPVVEDEEEPVIEEPVFDDEEEPVVVESEIDTEEV